MRAAVALVLGIVAAGGCRRGAPGSDDCRRFVDKSRPVMSDMMKTAGRTLSDADVAKMLATCQRGGTSKDPVFACVLAADDDAAVRACYLEGIGAKRTAR